MDSVREYVPEEDSLADVRRRRDEGSLGDGDLVLLNPFGHSATPGEFSSIATANVAGLATNGSGFAASGVGLMMRSAGGSA